MNIEILHLLKGAQKAKGITVIIDVFRAFSTACYAYGKGADKIIPVADIEIAYRLKKMYPEFLLMGERNEMRPPGFDFGNSPSQLPARLNNKTIVHTTSSGTQGIIAASNASEIITGSFVNAGAIVSYIRNRQPENISLVCMGYACLYPTDEDTLCARFIRNELMNLPSDYSRMVKTIRNGSGQRFFDIDKQEWAPQEDFDLCLKLNHFNFVLKVELAEGINFLRKIDQW
jgi:2-phosphosulfolactate phosphatase